MQSIKHFLDVFLLSTMNIWRGFKGNVLFLTFASQASLISTFSSLADASQISAFGQRPGSSAAATIDMHNNNTAAFLQINGPLHWYLLKKGAIYFYFALMAHTCLFAHRECFLQGNINHFICSTLQGIAKCYYPAFL